MTTLAPLRSQMHVITVTQSGKRYKLFSILYSPDGSVYVAFPYYKKTEGLGSLVVMPPGMPQGSDLSLTKDFAKVTRHRIKFAHHYFGEAHLSMDDRIITAIRKQSIPLPRLTGHLFTVSIKDIAEFEEARGAKYNYGHTNKRSTIHFDLDKMQPEGIKLVATWQSLKSLQKEISLPSGEQSISIFKYNTDPPQWGFVLGAPDGNPVADKVLLLRVQSLPPQPTGAQAYLHFMGGFDDPMTISNTAIPSSFISLLYPVTDFQTMLQQLGTMDISREV